MSHHHIVWINQDIQEQINHRWFQPNFWEEKDAIVGASNGRNCTYFVQQENKQWVLRHYYRGGLIARFSKDRYVFLSEQYSRAFAEFELLKKMKQLKLPVPKPIAAHIQRLSLFYRSNIIVERLQGYEDLSKWLERKQLSKKAWTDIGATIAQFHFHRIDHKDLNIKNILYNGDNVYLIDFDRCVQKNTHGRWQKSNMDRLLRSLQKETSLNENLHWNSEHWNDLLQAYQTKLQQLTLD